MSEGEHHNLDTEEGRRKFIKSFVSGGIAGCVAKTAIAPFDRIKMLYVDAVFIYKNHGFFNFWRGNSASVVRIFPYAAVNFSVFDWLRKTFYHPIEKDQEVSQFRKQITLFLCGSMAGVASSTICYPFDFLWVRLAMQKGSFDYNNFLGAIKTIFKQEGAKSFYDGLSISIAGIIVYHGFGFFIFTKIKEFMFNFQKQYAKSWFVDFTIGAIAGVVGQAVSYPFDILRKRAQGQNLLLKNKEIEKKLKIRELAVQIYKKEGIFRGFYKGLTLNVIKAPIANGSAWTTKNFVNRFLDKSYDF